MKCNNCGFENKNEGEYCGNCGNRLITNKELNDNNRQFQNLKPLKRKDIKKIFVMLGILLGITITIVLIINQLNKFKDPFDDIDDLNIVDITSSKKGFDESNSFTKKIEEDYKNGVLSKDEYIMQLAYSIYDTSKINNKYKLAKLNFNEPTELFEKFEGMINELSDDTIKYIFEKYTLSNVKWNVEKKSKTTATSNDLLNGIFDYKVKALDSKDADVSKLDHVKLSSNGNFLIYYTKEGINAITDSDAEKISKFLEAAVSGYKSKYNLDFKYDAQLSESVLGTVNEVISFGLFSQSTTKASQLLKNNNIDTKYLKTAMPVYIIDTDVENTSALGYYVAPIGGFAETILRVYNIFGNNGVKVDNMLTTYSFPFFVVSSSLNDLYKNVSTLDAGLNELATGITKFNEEGIKNVVSLIKPTSMRFKKLIELGEEYKTVNSKSTINDSETKFIYTTASLKVPEVKKVTNEITKTTSFLDRLKNLIK